MGFSPHHASIVPLVLNTTTGSISPQYHVVFDDDFSTIVSVGSEEPLPSFWNEIDLISHTQTIPLGSTLDNIPHIRHDEWLIPSKLEERHRSKTCQWQNPFRHPTQLLSLHNQLLLQLTNLLTILIYPSLLPQR